jgi:hypothetical protein
MYCPSLSHAWSSFIGNSYQYRGQRRPGREGRLWREGVSQISCSPRVDGREGGWVPSGSAGPPRHGKLGAKSSRPNLLSRIIISTFSRVTVRLLYGTVGTRERGVGRAERRGLASFHRPPRGPHHGDMHHSIQYRTCIDTSLQTPSKAKGEGSADGDMLRDFC